MFNISARGIYGVTAVLELAIRYEGAAVQIREIAEAGGIPQHYLEQILVILKRGGIVRSFRGAQGGYTLADHPSRIRLMDVLVLLEGPLEPDSGNRSDRRLRPLWNDLAAGIRTLLSRSFADLIEEINLAESRPDFVI